MLKLRSIQEIYLIVINKKIQKMTISIDTSIFEIKPTKVLYLISAKDLINVVRQLLKQSKLFSIRTEGAPIVEQVIGGGALINISRYLDKATSFSSEGKEVTIKIGAMIGNNLCGAFYGVIKDYVKTAKIILLDIFGFYCVTLCSISAHRTHPTLNNILAL
jgi:hypothetical protein